MITGVGGGSHGEQILKAVRLADTPYRVVGSDMSPYSTGLAMVDQPCLMPPAGDPSYVETLLGVCGAEHVDVLFHGSEPELRVLSEHRQAFAQAGVFLPLNPASVIETCLDKVRTMEALAALGFDVPAYRRIASVEEAEAFAYLPAVLKPSVGGGGSANLFLVQEREELVTCAGQLLKLYPEFIAQEYVGTPEDEFTVGVLLDMDGNLVNSIAIRRYILSALRQPHQGSEPDRSRRSRAGARDLQRRLPGPYRPLSRGNRAMRAARPRTRRTGRDQHPMPGRGRAGPCLRDQPALLRHTPLRAMVGYNEPDVLVRTHVLGESVVRHFAYREGVIVRSLAETLIDDVDIPAAANLAWRATAN